MQNACTFSRSIRANDLGTLLPYIECLIHWHESSGKPCTHFAQLYISVTDEVKINEQNRSIATGPFYVRTKFELIWTLLPEDVTVLNPVWSIGPCNVGALLDKETKIDFHI